MRSILVFLKLSLKQITSCFSSNRRKNAKALTDNFMEDLLLLQADECMCECAHIHNKISSEKLSPTRFNNSDLNFYIN